MAKTKATAGGKGKPDPDEVIQRGVKMRREYGDWLDRFAAHQRIGLSSLIDRALEAHAAATGFEAPPQRMPERTP